MAVGSAYPLPGSYAAAPMSAISACGCRSLTSPGPMAVVSTPMPRSISTFRRRCSAYSGATTIKNPVRVNPPSPPTASPQFRKNSKLFQARRASHSFV